MTRRDRIADEEIQDFIDDRLDRPARAALIARLLACPELGAEVEALRRQQEALRQIGQETLHEPVPARLRRILWRESGGRDDGNGQWPAWRARTFGLTVASAMIITGCIGYSG